MGLGRKTGHMQLALQPMLRAGLDGKTQNMRLARQPILQERLGGETQNVRLARQPILQAGLGEKRSPKTNNLHRVEKTGVRFRETGHGTKQAHAPERKMAGASENAKEMKRK